MLMSRILLNHLGAKQKNLPEVLVDGEQIKQVLLNLAIKGLR
jgi:nitrogen-specific signal transduction histidine kinase